MTINPRNQRIFDEVADTDEPIIVFRAQDAFFIDVLRHYSQLIESTADDDFKNRVMEIANDAAQWQAANPGRIKIPDLREEERPGDHLTLHLSEHGAEAVDEGS